MAYFWLLQCPPASSVTLLTVVTMVGVSRIHPQQDVFVTMDTNKVRLLQHAKVRSPSWFSWLEYGNSVIRADSLIQLYYATYHISPGIYSIIHKILHCRVWNTVDTGPNCFLYVQSCSIFDDFLLTILNLYSLISKCIIRRLIWRIPCFHHDILPLPVSKCKT